MTLVAGNVNLPNNFDVNGNPTGLSDIFSGIGTKAYNTIQGNYGGAATSANNDAVARGQIGQGSYSQQRLPTTEGLDVVNLGTTLGGAEGNDAYQSALMQRNFQQQQALTNEIGAAAAPAALQQIFGGIGIGARSAASVAPLFSSNPTSSGVIQDPTGEYAGSYDYGSMFGYDPSQISGYQLQPDELNNYGGGY